VVQVGGNQQTGSAPGETRSKLVAGLLGIFLGAFGVHRFYLGFTTMGGLMLGLQILGWLTACFVIGFFISAAVGIWGFVEGILILVGAINKDVWGRPLT
jgi:TM2 domain-containing membrane protein YozV